MTYTVHRPKQFTVTLVWNVEADSKEEAEQKVRRVVEQVDGELEEIEMEQDGEVCLCTIDTEGDP